MIGKGGTAGFLGKSFDPYTLYPDGDDMDMDKMESHQDRRSSTCGLTCSRSDWSGEHNCATWSTLRCPQINAAVKNYELDSYYDQALRSDRLRASPRGLQSVRRAERLRDKYGRNTFGQSCLLARRLVDAGTRVVEVIWPKVANSDNHSWDHHSGLTERMRDRSAPMLDAGLSTLD